MRILELVCYYGLGYGLDGKINIILLWVEVAIVLVALSGVRF